MPETLKPDELVERYERAAQNVERHAKKRECWPGDNDYDDAANALRDASSRILALQSDLERVTTALEKINAIRNSIIGFQTVNWSAHIYPMVAALQDAGFEGEGYEVAREKAQSFVERVNAAEARALTAEAALVKARTALEPFAKAADDAERLVGHDGPLGQYIDLADLRAARLALSAGEEENGR